MKRAVFIVTAAAVCAGISPLYGCAPQSGEGASNYHIEATYDGADTLTGRVTLDYYNDTENALDCLKFNLWGNAFRSGAATSPVPESARSQAYYEGASYGGMEITDVVGGAWQICGEDENILEVTLDAALYPEQRIAVTIDYTLTLAHVNARTGVAERSVNLGNFFPILCGYGQSGWAEHTYCAVGDPFVSDVADYTVSLTFPAEYVAAASGTLTESSTEDGYTTCEYRLHGARDFAIALSRDFKVLKQTEGGAEVSYYYYDDASPRDSLAAAAESLAYFSSTFGSYPYPSLSVVQTGLYTGGMEYPALTMISDDCDAQTATYAIVHENAHQWWYAAVGSDQYNNAWQDEGLAEYSSLLFFENAPQYGFTKAGLLGSATKAYRAYFSVYSQLFEGVDTGMARPLDSFSGEYEYANIAYNKGLLLFDALRNALGDDKFFEALREYRAAYSGRNAPAEGLMACFCSRGDCEGIFDSFLNGKVII